MSNIRFSVRKCLVWKIYDHYENEFYNFGGFNDFNFDKKSDAIKECDSMNKLHKNSIDLIENQWSRKNGIK